MQAPREETKSSGALGARPAPPMLMGTSVSMVYSPASLSNIMWPL